MQNQTTLFQQVKAQVFLPTGEKFEGKEVFRSPAGEKVMHVGNGKFVPCEARHQLQSAGQFKRPDFVVQHERRPTGHQAPKVKQNGNGGKKNKNGKN